MLETLDLIDWGSLEHEHRSAVDDPVWIRALLSDDAEYRKQARIRLWGRSNHFPTVDAVTSQTVPFLLELLKSRTVQDKPQLLIYLGALAWGEDRDCFQPLFPEVIDDPPEMLECREDAVRAERLERLRNELLECVDGNVERADRIERLEKEGRGWWRAARRAVVAGTDVYLGLLDDAIPEIRWSAAYMLGVGRVREPETIRRLEDRLKTELDDRVSASILLALSCVGGGDSAPLIERYLAPGHGGFVRIVAALSLARIAGRRTPKAAVRLLLETLADPKPIDQGYLQLPWTDRESVVSAVSAALSRLGVELAETTVPRIFDALDRQPRLKSESITLVAAIVNIVFEPREKPRDPGELSGFQRLVLRRMAGCERAWDWGNVNEIFKKFALPCTESEMAEFVQET